jgi:hypothetical protein
MRMAVAIYFTGISTPDLHRESPPLVGTLTTRPEAAEEPGVWVTAKATLSLRSGEVNLDTGIEVAHKTATAAAPPHPAHHVKDGLLPLE